MYVHNVCILEWSVVHVLWEWYICSCSAVALVHVSCWRILNLLGDVAGEIAGWRFVSVGCCRSFCCLSCFLSFFFCCEEDLCQERAT